MKKFLSVIGGIISVGVCAILLAIQISFLTLVSFKTLFNENTIHKMIETVDISDSLMKNMDSDTKEEIYKATGSIGLTVDDTNKILDSDALKDFLSNYLSNSVKSIYSNSNVVMSTKDIETLINNIEAEENINIENKEAIIKLINENSNEIEKTLNISQNLKEEIADETMMAIKFIMNGEIYIGFAVIFIIFFLLIALFRWSMYKPFIWYGITTITSGLLFFIPSVSLSLIMPYIVTEQIKDYETYITDIVKVIQTKMILCSVITIVLGIVLIVVYSLIKRGKHKDEVTEKLDNM